MKGVSKRNLLDLDTLFQRRERRRKAPSLFLHLHLLLLLLSIFFYFQNAISKCFRIEIDYVVFSFSLLLLFPPYISSFFCEKMERGGSDLIESMMSVIRDDLEKR